MVKSGDLIHWLVSRLPHLVVTCLKGYFHFATTSYYKLGSELLALSVSPSVLTAC